MADENYRDQTAHRAGSPEAGERDSSQLFTVVGIGASAGGLEALRDFLDPMPANSGMAFVVVVHLSPQHQSHLAELLQPYTEMPVTQVSEAVKMEPNHVYVIPPNRNLSTIDTHLRLSPLEESRSQRAPIDHFFRTLASTHGEKAIGVILTGGGSDGAVGIKQIKEAGGLIVAQDPAEAAYDSMPQSAIATGFVDYVLPVAAMARELLAYVQRRPALQLPDDEADLADEERATVQKIFAQLRAITGHDFSRYKRATVLRRLRRRLQLRDIATLETYLETLRLEQEEVRALFTDLLITVTNFFRDQEAFAALEQAVIPQLFAGKDAGDVVRVWVPGCATGEEAYSLAILLLEQAERLDRAPALQVFATDISQDALAVAREGFYTGVIGADVTAERLARFFSQEPGGYRVREEVRELILFAPHSLLKDPPFSRLDLISCRNLLIYLQRDLQRQLAELFHYALLPGGYLFLGVSEGVDHIDLFRTVSPKHSIYRRQEVTSAQPFLPALPLSAPEIPEKPAAGPGRRQEARNYGSLHAQLAEQYAPASILVNEDHKVVHVSEQAGRYLHVAGGELASDALQLVREELRVELTTMLYRAFDKKQASRSNPIPVRLDGQPRAVTLYTQPVAEEGQAFAVIFFLEGEPVAGRRADRRQVEPQDEMVRELEEELAAAKKQLRTTVEEFESSKEEMRAANEELQSMNEELRSTTEELETSKEELQSINEELLTVNEENKNKVDELSRLTGDLQNLLTATEIATLFLDRQLHIQRFTPAVADLFNIMQSDRGRPLSHLTHKLVDYDGLLEDALAVLKTLVPIEREVTGEDNRHYFLRLLPYRTIHDRIDGVVITLIDITTLRQTEHALAQSRERYRLIVEGVKEYAMLTMDAAGRIDSWNQGARRLFGYEEEEIIGRPGATIFTPEDRASGAVDEELRRAREEGQAMNERWHLRKDGSRFWGSGVVTSLWDNDHLGGYAKVMRDNTRRKQAEEELHQSQERLQALNETLEERVQERTAQVRRLASELVLSEQKVRHRISQVLHDNLQQLLYAQEMQLQFLREDTAGASLAPEQVDALDRLSEMLQESLRLTRQLTVELSPPVLKGEGLLEALAWLARHMNDLYGLHVTVHSNDHTRITDADLRILLFQIVRELLFNVVKHAGVSEARVTLQAEDGGITIEVADSGQGFDVTQVPPPHDGGFGLHNVRERLQLFGGRFEVHSQPGAGTRATLHLPHQSAPDRAEER